MEIRKETVTTILTTDSKKITENDLCVFNALGKSYIGRFKGISKKGSMIFESEISKNETIKFTVMPKSISEIYLAKIDILTDNALPFGGSED